MDRYETEKKDAISMSDGLVEELNKLLSFLSLPIALESPQDLTPSLLIAILESILRERLPISMSLRESSTPSAKIEAMKIFLGVFEGDILKMDIGLSEMDPRRLAAGGWDEVVFIGQALCALGRQLGEEEEENGNMETGLSVSLENPEDASTNPVFSRFGESETAPTQELHTPTDHPSPSLIPLHNTSESERYMPFQNNNQSLDTPVENSLEISPLNAVSMRGLGRYDGDLHGSSNNTQKNIGSRSTSHQKSPRSYTISQAAVDSAGAMPPDVSSPAQYTLALLRERARLLEELANCHAAEIS